MAVRSDRRYLFSASRGELWNAFTDVERYRSWWPWLRAFDGRKFAAGERWHCVVKPQLPYTLEFEIVLDDVIELASAHASLTGDIVGVAELTLTDDGRGSGLRLRSELTAKGGPARWVDKVAPPVAKLGHDWILDNGIRQFRMGSGV